MTMPDGVCDIVEGKGRVCRDILADLPDWFGIPEAVDAYVREAESLPMLGVVVDGDVVGFLSLKRHTPFAAEAYVLGVKRRFHRQGIGSRLFAAAEARLVGEGTRYLTVKTVAAERPDEAYAKTRRFYEAIGFVPIEVFPSLWGPQNPCLLMIKPLASGG